MSRLLQASAVCAEWGGTRQSEFFCSLNFEMDEPKGIEGLQGLKLGALGESRGSSLGHEPVCCTVALEGGAVCFGHRKILLLWP